ncbi:two-component regulator propeller domain-containing protein [candidate division KSB1 bacterium]
MNQGITMRRSPDPLSKPDGDCPPRPLRRQHGLRPQYHFRIFPLFLVPILFLLMPPKATAQQWQKWTKQDGSIPGDDLERLELDRDGRLWLTTRHSGAAVYQDGQWIKYGVEQGLPSLSFLFGLAPGPGGRVAFGSFGSGISLIDHQDTPADTKDDLVLKFGTGDGLLSNKINALTYDPDGNLWIGYGGDGLQVLTPETELISFPVGVEALASGMVVDLRVIGSRYVLIVLGLGGGVDILDHGGTPADPDDDRWEHFSETADGLASDHVKSIAAGWDNRIWFATSAGLSILGFQDNPFQRVDYRWTTLDSDDGLVGNGVAALDFDGYGGVWIGTGSGVSRYLPASGQWTSFTPLSTGGILPESGVKDLVYDRALGILWLATGDGLCSYRSGFPTTPVQSVVAYPNPCRVAEGHDRVRFRAQFRIEETVIYSAAGESVRRLQGGENWDLTDRGGRPVPSGMYAFVARGEGGILSRGWLAVLR